MNTWRTYKGKDWVHDKKYKWLPETTDRGDTMLLFLACPASSWDAGGVKYKLRPKEPERWIYIANQTGGIACHHVFMCGMQLTPRPGIADLMLKIHAKMENVMCRASFNEVALYRKMLHGISPSIDCQGCYADMEEAFYPVDFTDKAANVLCVEKIGEPNDLFRWKDNWARILGGRKWHFVFLAENSD